jgi:competence protein ComEA
MLARFRPIAAALAVALSLAVVAVTAPTPAAFAAPATAKAAAGDAKPVDLNTADAATLETVPGIGKSLAQRILTFREKNGAFGSVDDLLKVQGIGEKSLQHLRPYLVVSKAK